MCLSTGLNYDEVQTTLTDQLRVQPSLPLSKKEMLEKKRKQQQRQQQRDSEHERRQHVVKKISTKQNAYSTINTFNETKASRFSETAVTINTSSNVVENNIENRKVGDDDNSDSNRTKDVAIHIESNDNVLFPADDVIISDSDDMKKSVITSKSKKHNNRSKKRSNDYKSGSKANSHNKEEDVGDLDDFFLRNCKEDLRKILNEIEKKNDT